MSWWWSVLAPEPLHDLVWYCMRLHEKRLSLGYRLSQILVSNEENHLLDSFFWKTSLLFQEDIVRPILSNVFEDIARHYSMDNESRNWERKKQRELNRSSVLIWCRKFIQAHGIISNSLGHPPALLRFAGNMKIITQSKTCQPEMIISPTGPVLFPQRMNCPPCIYWLM